MKFIASLLLCVMMMLTLVIPVLSQCKDISAKASPAVIEKKALFEDEVLAKRFSVAKGPLNWLLINAPNLSTGLYIKGAETFDALAQAEKNPPKKQAYIDSLMIIYDLRIKTCGEEANVTNRKAMSFYKYYFDSEVKSKEILPLMDKAIALSNEKILDGLAESYMTVVRISADQKLLDENQILIRYEKITSIIDSKIKKAEAEGKPTDRYKKMNDDNLTILTHLIKIDCDFVRKKFGPQFKQNPSDLELAKKIFNFMLKDKCTDDPLWLQAAETLHASEKDFGLAKVLALRYLSTKEYDKATPMLEEALQLAKSPSDKAEILGLQAQQQEMLGRHDNARQLYLRALAADPSKKEYYARIGDIYMNSFSECKQEKHKAEDRFVFLTAYDMYQRAGETQKMANAKSSFPSMEEIFELGYERGDKVKVACWINEETIIRTRN